jgi:hypothetical protein
MTGLAKAHQAQEEVDIPRYDPSIYSTPFSELPDRKRVWLGTPGSTLEGLGSLPFSPVYSLFYGRRLQDQDDFLS